MSKKKTKIQGTHYFHPAHIAAQSRHGIRAAILRNSRQHIYNSATVNALVDTFIFLNIDKSSNNLRKCNWVMKGEEREKSTVGVPLHGLNQQESLIRPTNLRCSRANHSTVL